MSKLSDFQSSGGGATFGSFDGTPAWTTKINSYTKKVSEYVKHGTTVTCHVAFEVNINNGDAGQMNIVLPFPPADTSSDLKNIVFTSGILSMSNSDKNYVDIHAIVIGNYQSNSGGIKIYINNRTGTTFDEGFSATFTYISAE